MWAFLLYHNVFHFASFWLSPLCRIDVTAGVTGSSHKTANTVVTAEDGSIQPVPSTSDPFIEIGDVVTDQVTNNISAAKRARRVQKVDS